MVKNWQGSEMFRRSKFLLTVICLLQLIIHLPWMNRPAMGNHVWRQVNTLAVARNYATENMDFFKPRIDKRYHFTGVTGMEFPLYSYGLAGLYKLTGIHENVHRWFSLCISLFVLTGIFFLARSFLPDSRFALMASLITMFIPEFYYHSINAVPDLLAMAFMLWGWVFFRKWLKTFHQIFWFAGVVLFLLAGATKLLYLIPGLLIALDVFTLTVNKKKAWTGSVLAVILIAVPVYFWYQYAHALTFKDWLNEFVHDVRWADNTGDAWRIFRGNLLRDVPETWLGYFFIPPFLAGIWWLGKTRYGKLLILTAVLSACLIYLPLQKQFELHGYYYLCFIPFAALAAARGLYQWLGVNKWIPFILFGLAMVWANLRMDHNWQPRHSRLPADFLRPSFRDSAELLSDTSTRWIVGPDQTGCVYFYYLRAKGFPWYNAGETATDFDRHVSWGKNLRGMGIITNDTAGMAARAVHLQLTPAGRAGDFYWYRIRGKK